MASTPTNDNFIFCRYITVKGKRIYHPTGGVFKIPKDKLKPKKKS